IMKLLKKREIFLLKIFFYFERNRCEKIGNEMLKRVLHRCLHYVNGNVQVCIRCNICFFPWWCECKMYLMPLRKFYKRVKNAALPSIAWWINRLRRYHQ